MLGQIAGCLAYAEKFDRKVVVDTEYKLGAVRDRLANYFSSAHANLLVDIKDAPTIPLDGPCIPHFIAGRVNDCKTTWIKGRGHVEVTTGEPIAFDFDRDYPEPLLVRSRAGGGADALGVLKYLRITPLLADHIAQRLIALPGRYCGIHIRATDYQTDYEAGLHQISGRLTDRVFVATDSIVALQYARDTLVGHQAFSFTELSAADGKPLHKLKFSDASSKLQNNLDSLADLFLLAMAENIFAFKLVDPQRVTSRPRYSGYSKLAAKLHRSGDLLRNLLGAHDELDRQLERLNIVPGFPQSQPPEPIADILAS